MAECAGVTDAAFVHLRGIHTLDMSYCDQRAITDAAFAHLAGIQRLSIWGCRQATITDAAFAHLRGIQLLNMSECNQLTDAAFMHLRGIHTLSPTIRFPPNRLKRDNCAHQFPRTYHEQGPIDHFRHHFA
jgi:hypothetical protein